jgi:DNA-directed RNA polymerase subunit E'/Rpb7
MNIVSPYKSTDQYTKILLECHQMNSDIRNNLKINLKKKVEGKCNKNAYIISVYRIISFSEGLIKAENFGGQAIYDICYHAKICIPIENTIIICKTKIVNNELIIAVNNCIMAFIPQNNISTEFWNVSKNCTHIKTNKQLNIDDYVCVRILNKRINRNDTQIKIIGSLLDLPTNEEIIKYYGHTIEEDLEKEETTNFI